jgi:hypothetical protein
MIDQIKLKSQRMVQFNHLAKQPSSKSNLAVII